jgi:hypothetical protein
MFVEERKKGVLDVSLIPSSIIAHAPGYIDKENEVIVGLRTDAPLKRAIMPNGGWRMVLSSLKTYGYEAPQSVVDAFTKYRKTHNDGVFDANRDCAPVLSRRLAQPLTTSAKPALARLPVRHNEDPRKDSRNHALARVGNAEKRDRLRD